MKIKNILASFMLALTILIIPFVWPATDIKVFGQEIKWNGLNLSTVTDDRLEGELQFEENIYLRGGTKYLFTSDLALEEEDRESIAEDTANKFVKRLESYGFHHLESKWWIEDDALKVEVLLPHLTDQDNLILQLLASQGDIRFYTQDPEYDPSAQDEESQGQISIFEGMIDSGLTREDLIYVKSNYGNASNGYGFKVKFKEDSALSVLLFNQNETYRATMMLVDGQPVAVRSAQIQTPGTLDGYEPVVYMSSIIDESFEVNDAVVSIYRSGELPHTLVLESSNEISPLLASGIETNIKLAMISVFALISVLVFWRYRWNGLYSVFITAVSFLWLIFVLKLLTLQLSISVLIGLNIALVLFFSISLKFTSNIQSRSIKMLDGEVFEVLKTIRRYIMAIIIMVIIASFVASTVLNDIVGVLGFGTSVLWIWLYIGGWLYYRYFYAQQLRYEKNN